MEIEVVAFASSQLDPACGEGRALLREAIAAGADVLGAVPACYAKPAHSIDALMELAALHNLPVDVHLDENLDPRNSWSEYLADATLDTGWQGRVTLSHGCALSVLAPQDRTRILDKLLRAEIIVVALPLTNLYLQDRGNPEPRRRGLTCVHELLAAGIEFRFASDNVQDAFYPFGNADLLDAAYAGMLAGQVDETDSLVRAICDGRSSLQVGDTADMVLIKGTHFDDVLSRRPPERIVIHDAVIIDA
jgi:cytosine deaminase